MNPLKQLSEVSGLSPEHIKRIGEEVKQNHELLRNCSGHDFVDESPDKQLGKTFRCSRCQGTVDAVKRMWYLEGIKHATAKYQDAILVMANLKKELSS